MGCYEPQLWDALAQHLLEPPSKRRGKAAAAAEGKGGAARQGRIAAGGSSRGGELGEGEPLLASMTPFELAKLVWAFAKVCRGEGGVEGLGLVLPASACSWRAAGKQDLCPHKRGGT